MHTYTITIQLIESITLNDTFTAIMDVSHPDNFTSTLQDLIQSYADDLGTDTSNILIQSITLN
jgi:hypothetical protein